MPHTATGSLMLKPPPSTVIHRFVGDALHLLVPVYDLAFADVLLAGFAVQGGPVKDQDHTDVELFDAAALPEIHADDGTAVVSVFVQASETAALGPGRWRWHLRAGGSEAEVVARGYLVLSRRIPAPT